LERVGRRFSKDPCNQQVEAARGLGTSPADRGQRRNRRANNEGEPVDNKTQDSEGPVVAMAMCAMVFLLMLMS
jgi:hypothetical protein